MMKLSFLSWNIWFNEDQREERTKHLLEQARTFQPDFIALQEVMEDSLEVIKKNLGDYYLIGAPFQTRYDNIILSRYACVEWYRYMLPRTNMGRSYLIGQFIMPDDRILNVGTFHLESVFNGNPGERLKGDQLSYIDSISPQRTVFMGDTNLKTQNHFPEKDIFIRINRPLAYEYTYAGETNLNIRNRKLNSRFDRIYLKTDEPNRIKTFLLTGTEATFYYQSKNRKQQPSDHYGVYTEIDFN